ncbi:hypothetical protein D3C71_1387960 [compost metagenome]
MNGLVKTIVTIAHRSGSKHTDRACQHRSLIAQNVTKHVLSNDNIKASWTAQQLHCAIINEHVLNLYLRIFWSNLIYNLTP